METARRLQQRNDPHYLSFLFIMETARRLEQRNDPHYLSFLFLTGTVHLTDAVQVV